MKISAYTIIILVVGLVLILFASMVNDMQAQYPNIEIENSSWTGVYDSGYAQDIDVSATNIQVRFERLGDEREWYTKIGEGVLAIPLVLFDVVVMVFASLGFAVSMLTNSLTQIKSIPPVVTGFAVTGIIVMVVFAIVGWWHRSKS